jgi:hypothetical protein
MFFEAIIRRVNNEIIKIGEKILQHHQGLRLLCLGGVKREIISSRLTRELSDTSANRHDTNQENDQEEEDLDTLDNMSDQISHLMNKRATKFMPKSIVIRGNTIWWQRRRLFT